MNPTLVFIASCLIGILIIELRAHYLMRKIIHRRITALLAYEADRAQRRAEQTNSDDCKQ